MRSFAALLLSIAVADEAHAQSGELADFLRKQPLDSPAIREKATDQAWNALRARRRAANERSTRDWRKIETREQWEAFRDASLRALRASLGDWPAPPKEVKVAVARKLAGDGFVVENICYESRPGLVVTANLYSPAKPGASMPAFVIVHSHHNPKTQGELQDMGMLWARLGCVVLVPDMLGHGERRQHPFTDASKFAGSFKPGRQDYYFRYNSAVQLHLAGESLIGWMAWDLMRGIDVLVQKPGVDAKRIVLLGSVAGGGDPAGVIAALDPRVAAVAPFNFGGPQPETTFPLPADAEDSFNYLGGGSWESTRNLRLSGRDGFLPWVIVGSVAPRGLIHAHEFAWDSERDPVWKRYQKIYALYDAADRLAAAHGRGSVRGSAPDSTHCNNIGAVHRKPIYPVLKKWFDIPEPDKEYQNRLPATDLACLTPETRAALQPKPLHVLAREVADRHGTEFRDRLAKLSPDERRRVLREKWTTLLGLEREKSDVTLGKPSIDVRRGAIQVVARSIVYQVKPYPAEEIPVLFVLPAVTKKSTPVVIALAHEGRRGFLTHRADVITGLLAKGVAVCVPDFRATGSGGRGRTSGSTSLSASEQMLGRTLLGTRLDELGLLLDVLRSKQLVTPASITLWGDSFAPVNDGKDVAVPLDADKMPASCEPLGGLLALLGALFHDDVTQVHVRGGLVSYRSILDSPFLYVPHDAVVPGALTAGDLADVAASLAPRPVRLEALVDGLNRRVDEEALKPIDRSKNVSVSRAESSVADMVRMLASAP